MRKLPVRHRVRSHTRKGDSISRHRAMSRKGRKRGNGGIGGNGVEDDKELSRMSENE